MRTTLDAIQARIAGIVDQDENTANISSTDYSLRLSYINRALSEWGDIAAQYGHRSVYKEYNMLVSTSTGNASIVLPQDFRLRATYPNITYDGVTTKQFSFVEPEEDKQFDADDERVWILGNPNTGYILRVFGPTLASGASVNVPYYASPQSLASPANIADIPNPEFLVERSLSYLFQAQEDSRFPFSQRRADTILSNMLEFESIPSRGDSNWRVKTVEETMYGGFRWGE